MKFAESWRVRSCARRLELQAILSGPGAAGHLSLVHPRLDCIIRRGKTHGCSLFLTPSVPLRNHRSLSPGRLEDVLSRCPDLQTLDVQNAALAVDAVAALQRATPQLRSVLVTKERAPASPAPSG